MTISASPRDQAHPTFDFGWDLPVDMLQLQRLTMARLSGTCSLLCLEMFVIYICYLWNIWGLIVRWHICIMALKTSVSLFFFFFLLNQHSGDRSQLDQLMIICGCVTRFLFKSITKFFFRCVCKETFRKMWWGAELESEHCPVVRAQNLVSDV